MSLRPLKKSAVRVTYPNASVGAFTIVAPTTFALEMGTSSSPMRNADVFARTLAPPRSRIPASSKRTELTIRAGFHTGDVSFGIDRNKARKIRNGSETAEEDFVLERQTRRQNVGGGIWKAGKEYSGIAACRFHELAGQLPRHKVKCKLKKR